MEQRLSLVTLGVTDLARARTFYEQQLSKAPNDFVKKRLEEMGSTQFR